MILIYHLKSLTDEYSIILATWPFGEPPPPLTWPFVAFWLTPLPPLLATWFLDAPLGRFPIEIKTKIRYLSMFGYHNFMR